jgi:phosphoglucosamine mutase
MQQRIFGTDGVRGLANVEPVTAETALKLGRALAHEVGVWGKTTNRVLVGKDTRVSGYMLEYALAAGICSMGTDVLLVGPIPTPGIAFLTTSMRCDAGAVISASHNPADDNGIKLFFRDGFKLSDEMETSIEQKILSESINGHRPRGIALGKISRVGDALGRYVVFTKSTFPKELTLHGMKIVIDCANGAAYRAAPMVLGELGADVEAIAVSPDGSNINEKCGSLHPELLCETVRRKKADVGIALDGDADRVIFADERGVEVDGDQIMGIIARDMIQRGRLLKNTLVVTVMSSIGLDQSLQQIGGTVVRTRVGDRYVVEEMRQRGCNFGGEQSGHLIFLDHTTSGDGIIAALQILKVMAETGKRLSELAAWVKKYPQVLKNVEVRSKKNLAKIPEVCKVIQESRARLQNRGRILVRYSGTQPVCRVMAEGQDPKEIAWVVDDVCDAIRRHA